MALHPFVQAFLDECHDLCELKRLAVRYERAVKAGRGTKIILRETAIVVTRLRKLRYGRKNRNISS